MDDAGAGVVEFALWCAGCGGDLKGVRLDGVCGQCGDAVGRTLDVGAVDGATLAVAADVTCVRCGYNLRTLRLGSNCPECAGPIVESLRPNALEFADRRWLTRVRRGVTLELVAGLGFVAICVGMMVLALTPAFGGMARARGWAVAALALGIGMLGVVVVYAIGVFGVTSRNPADGAAASRRPAWAARVLVFAPCLFAVRGALTGQLVGGTFGSYVYVGMGVAGLMGSVASFPCMLACLRGVARQARRHGLARLTTVAVWLTVGACVVGGGSAVVTGMIVTRGTAGAAVAASTPVPGRSAGTVAAPPAAGAASGAVGSGGAGSGGATVSGGGTGGAPSVTVTSSGQVVTRSVTPSGQVVTTTTTSALAPMAVGLVSCVAGVLYLACVLVIVIVLFKYRGMLSSALAVRRAGGRRDVVVNPHVDGTTV